MKAYTDISQSQNLLNILPIDTCDLCYNRLSKNDEFNIDILRLPIHMNTFSINEGYQLPCWSLTALLNELGKIKEHWFYHLIFDFTLNKYSVEVEADFWRYEGDLYDNAIDAVYEAILKLHEQKSK